MSGAESSTDVYSEILAAKLYAAYASGADDLDCLDDDDYMSCVSHLMGAGAADERLQDAIDLYVHMVADRVCCQCNDVEYHV